MREQPNYQFLATIAQVVLWSGILIGVGTIVIGGAVAMMDVRSGALALPAVLLNGVFWIVVAAASSQMLHAFRDLVINSWEIRASLTRQTPPTTAHQPEHQPAGGIFGLADVDVPGRFQVEGIDAETGLETELVVTANNRAAAQAKAEVRGIRVTDIRWISFEPTPSRPG